MGLVELQKMRRQRIVIVEILKRTQERFIELHFISLTLIAGAYQ